MFDDNVATGGAGADGYSPIEAYTGSTGYTGGYAGDGGSAAAGVANFGLANSNNVLFNNGQATGGSGGSGGHGGDGGYELFNYNGGDGGDGGSGGDGGDATLGILNGNTGTLTGNNTGSYTGTTTAGFSGSGGSGGAAGSYYDPVTTYTYNGSAGSNGSSGSSGIAGQTGATFFNQGGDVSGFTDSGSAPFFHGGVIATAGDDILTAGGGIQTMIGLAGDDTFNGGFNTDTIFAGAGNDLIQVTGDSFFDNVHGGSGVDTLDHSTANGVYSAGGGSYGGADVINFATGEMTFNSTGQVGYAGNLAVSGIEIFLDNDNSNSIIASDVGMTINGNGGDDTIEGGLGNDILNGGINGMAGDTLSFAGFAATVGTTGITVDLGNAALQNTGAGLDTITGFENVIGSDYDDTIRGDANRNSLYGGGGNDTIISNSNFANVAGEIIDGGMGFDTLRFVGLGYEPTPATHDLRDDTITSIEILQLQDSGYYGARSILLNADQFGGGAISSSASIQLDGFVDSAETINIDMNGQSALDISGLTFNGARSSARFDIVGGGLAENITGSLIRDIINGGAGADILSGGGGNDTIDGGDQGDTINGGDGEDILNGGQGADTINGGDDNDTIDGGLSSGDILNGEGGDDTIFGGAGNDTIDGGTGVDTVDYSGFGGNVTVNLNNNGSPQTAGGGGVDVITNVENIMAGDFADRLTGRGGDSEIHGGAGGDRIFGIGGNDMLFGEGANDFIQGGNGDDMIYGGDGQDQLDGGNDNDMLFGGDDNSLDRLTGAAGDDVLDGGGGRDILRGDSISGGVVVTGGADIFDFNEVNDSLAGGSRDIIRDFVQGEDLIDLLDIDAITGGADDDFTFIGTADFSNTAGELRYQFGGSHTIISADVDGDGVADFQIDLNGNVTLTSSDFVFAGPL